MDLRTYLGNINRVLDSIRGDSVDNFVTLLVRAHTEGRMVFVIGNGGSAANASHFVQDLAKGVIPDRTVKKRIRALSLCDNLAYITAVGNDDGYEHVFESQLKTLAQAGDILVAISGSGRSKNITLAVDYAKELGMSVVGITGFDGGTLIKSANLVVHIPLNEMCTVEGIHSVVLHYIVLRLREILTGVPFDHSCFEFR